MSQTLESKVRHELERERRLLDALRADPQLLKPELRDRHAEILAPLEELLARASDAIDRLGARGSAGRSAACEEFEVVWSELKSRVRLVLR